MSRLNTTIHINNADGRFIFGPDDELPKWAEDKIRQDNGDGVFAKNSKGTTKPARDPDEVAALKARIAELEAAAGGKPEPAQGPRDSGDQSPDYHRLRKDELEALAKERKVEIADGAKKDEIVDALKSADEAAAQK